MSTILTILSGLGPWAWFILALILMALETVIPGVHFIWFGIAAAIVGGLVLLMASAGAAVPGGSALLGWDAQLIAFAVIAVASVFLVRRFARTAETASDEPALNARGTQYVGRVVKVDEPIAQGRGKVRVGDTVWLAEGPDTPAGARVRVVGANGTILVVAPEAH